MANESDPSRVELSSEGLEKLQVELEIRGQQLPSDWRQRIEQFYPEKRAAVEKDMDQATLELADSLYQIAVGESKQSFSAAARRLTAVALLYLIDESDLIPDPIGARGLIDDKHVIHSAARKILKEFEHKFTDSHDRSRSKPDTGQK